MNLKDWSERLVWATILVGVVRYAAAFAASDVGQITGVMSNVLTVLLSLTGIGMGILDTVGGGLLFNGWSRVFPKTGQHWSLRFKVLTLCVFGLLISGLFILVPFTMSRISHESVLDALGGKDSVWAWVWSTMVNLIPYILIAGVFTGNKMVSSLETESSPKVTENLPKEGGSGQKDEGKVSGNLPKDWRKLRPLLQYEQVLELANLSANGVKKVSEEYKVDERTVVNWRKYARLEVSNRIN